MKFLLFSLLLSLNCAGQNFTTWLKPDNDIRIANRKFTVSGATDSSVSFATIAGRPAIKFLNRQDFPVNPEEGSRSEIGRLFTSGKQNQHATFWTYFPAKTTQATDYRWGLWNFHDHPDEGEGDRSPSIICYAQNDHLYLMIGWSAKEMNSWGKGGTLYDGYKYIDLGVQPKDRCVDWDISVRFAYDATGYLNVKFDGKTFEYKGPNWYKDKIYPTFKCGIYTWTWNVDKRLCDLIELYFSNPVIVR